MILFERNALYTRADLVEMLTPIGIDADSLIARIKPRKIHRLAWWGGDIIQAIESAPALTDGKDLPPARSRGGRKGKTVGSFTEEELGL